jgi:TolB-like protein
MKRFTGLAVAVCGTAVFLASALTVAAGPRELSYATEDAAYQAVMQMATDGRVNVKRIAFVKLMRGSTDVSEYSNIATVFENGLVQVPTEFEFVTHQDRTNEWTEIDRFFDAVNDFGDYDKLTLPKIGVFKMVDAFIIGQVIDAQEKDRRSSIRISLRLIRVDTAERLWAGTIEGVYDDPGPDYEVVSDLARQAVNQAVQQASADGTLARLSGYQIFVLPFEGPLGRATTQTFIKKITEDASVQVLDLPNGSASDRMMARFLRERAGTNRQVSNSALKRLTTDYGGVRDRPSEKIAVLKGAVTTLEVSPMTIVDPVGACLSRATASLTLPKVNPVRIKIGFDSKFLDINNSFATVASVKGFGDVILKPGSDIWAQLLSLMTLRNVALLAAVLVGVLIVGWLVSKMFRVR